MQVPFSTPTRNPSNNFAPKPERFRGMSWQWPLIWCVWNTVTEYSRVGQTHPVSPYHGGLYVAQVCAPTFDRVPRYENKKPMNGSSLPKRSCEWRVEGCLAYTCIHGCGNVLFQLAAPSSVPIVPILMTSYNIISYYRLCWYNPAVCHEHPPCAACSGSPHDDELSDWFYFV